MFKFLSLAAVMFVAAIFSGTVSAQSKTGYIDLNELVTLMPEYKQADATLAEYQTALNQQYAEQVMEFNKEDSILASRDTLKMTASQLELRRNKLGASYVKLQGWNNYAQQQYGAKENEVLKPVLAKANSTIEQVAKANGFTAVFNRSAFIVPPPATEDLLPLCKKKLGIQ